MKQFTCLLAIAIAWPASDAVAQETDGTVRITVTIEVSPEQLDRILDFLSGVPPTPVYPRTATPYFDPPPDPFVDRQRTAPQPPIPRILTPEPPNTAPSPVPRNRWEARPPRSDGHVPRDHLTEPLHRLPSEEGEIGTGVRPQEPIRPRQNPDPAARPIPRPNRIYTVRPIIVDHTK